MRLQRRVTNLRYAALRLLAPASLILLASHAWAADPLQMTVQSVFGRAPVENGVIFEVSNDGPDAQGAVKINAAGGTTVYPIELPRGSKKKFIGYPMSSSYRAYDQVSYDLDTNRGSLHLDSLTGSHTAGPTYYSANQSMILEIGDDSGSLQFLGSSTRPRRTSYGGEMTVVPLYAKPESAPGRLMAYRDLPCVVLGPGSERISDDAVHALTEYVIGGGRLVFDGGAAAAPLHDVRWKSILPIVGPHAVTNQVSLHIGTEGFRDTLSVQEGATVAGCKVSQGGVISMPYGVGEVVVLPFDLLEGPLKAWSGRAAYFNDLTKTSTGLALAWPSLADGADDYSYGARYIRGSRTGGGVIGPAGAPNLTNDPFSYQAPDAETVGALVLCYLILVAPVNFLILRKLKRSELAWFTTPFISIIFAVFILRLAAGLYLGKMMTTVSGQILVAENQPVGIFRGSSQLFFPSGGSYDLKLRNVDWLSEPQSFGYQARGKNGADLTALDVGQMVVPDLNVKNLQFKDVGFEQLVDTTGWFTLGVVRTGNAVKITVANHSPYELQGGTVWAEGGEAPITSLPAGGSSTVTVPVVAGRVSIEDSRNLPPPPGGPPGGPPIVSIQTSETAGLATYGRRIHRAIFSGTIVGFRPGPQLGSDVAARNQIRLNVIGDTSTSTGATR